MQGVANITPIVDQEIPQNVTRPDMPETGKAMRAARELNEDMDISKARETFSSIIGMMVKKSTDLTDKIDRGFE